MTEPTPLAPRPAELDDRILGVLDTGAEGSSRFLDLLVARLEQRHFLTAVLRVAKPNDREPCPAALLEQLTDRADVVVTGVCQSSAVAAVTALDAASLKRRVIPCAVVLTDDVPPEASAAAGGDAPLAFVQLRGSPRGLSDEALGRLVEESFRDVERAVRSQPRHHASADSPRADPPTHFPPRRRREYGEIRCEC
ncbi:MAG: UGSC family (seleno)protein [Geodermatophilaceae bacterium]